MTNPGDAVGTNGGYGGRTSVNAFNDVLSAFDGPGIIDGWQCIPKTGMTVALGGQSLTRDVAVAQNDLGQRTTLDNISVQPIDVTLSTAPTLGSRIDAIVGYVNNPPDSNGSLIDNPDTCGLIIVESSVTTSPTVPNEAMIREAITADSGAGVTAYYVVLATVQVGTGVDTITANDITQGRKAIVSNIDIPEGGVTGSQIADHTITSKNLSGSGIGNEYETKSGTVSLANGSWRTAYSFTAPSDGCYSFTGRISGDNAGATKYSIEVGLTFKGQRISGHGEYSTPNWSGNNIASGYISQTLRLEKGETVELVGYAGNRSPTCNWTLGVQQIW